MRCQKSSFIENTIFHIYNHSTAEIKLYKEIADYEFYMQKIINLFDMNNYEIYAYCLMPNHFHFCIKQNSSIPFYDLLCNVNTSYAMYFNRKYNRKGKVFAGKLQHKLLSNDNCLIALCQYIHYNPVKAGIVSNCKDWKYSNYHEYIEISNSGLYSKELIEMYPNVFENYSEQIQNYEKYLEEKKFSDLLFV